VLFVVRRVGGEGGFMKVIPLKTVARWKEELGSRGKRKAGERSVVGERPIRRTRKNINIV